MMKYLKKNSRWNRWLLVVAIAVVITILLFQNLSYEQPTKLYETFNSQSCEPHHQQQQNNIVQKHYPSVIIMEKTFVPTSIFSFLSPGTDHWYHFLEHIIINLPFAKANIWKHGTTNNIHSKNGNSIMYIIFQEKQSTDKLNEFGILLLTAIMSGGLFHHVKIGYTEHSDVTLAKLFPHVTTNDNLSVGGDAAATVTNHERRDLSSTIKNESSYYRWAPSMSSISFTQTHSVQFPSSSSSSSSFTKPGNNSNNTTVKAHLPRFVFETNKQLHHHLKSVLSESDTSETICITKSQTFVGKFTIPIMNRYNLSDTYEWFGRSDVSLDLYLSFRQAVARLCANSYLNNDYNDDNSIFSSSRIKSDHNNKNSNSKNSNKNHHNTNTSNNNNRHTNSSNSNNSTNINNEVNHHRNTLNNNNKNINTATHSHSHLFTTDSNQSFPSNYHHYHHHHHERKMLYKTNNHTYLYMSDNPNFNDRNADYYELKPTYITNRNYQNLVIYQRDVSRRLINAEYVYQQFSQHLSHNNHNNDNKNSHNNNSHNSHNNNNNNTTSSNSDTINLNNNNIHSSSSLLSSSSSSSSSSSLPEWKVEIFMHSNDRSVCDLIEKISTTTIFITPHGFQSILLLFQPLSSIFIEIHPYLYFKPNYYGDIQTSLRNHLHLFRSYLAQESQPDRSFLGQWIFYLKKTDWLDNYICGHSVASRGICRYIFRLQSVSMPSELIEDVVRLIQQYYIIQ